MLFRFHGHTEQGVRTAARLFGKAAMLSSQECNAWIPSRLYPDSIGDGISAFVRAGKEEFFENGPADPAQADFTILFEPSLLDPKSLREGSVLIVNSMKRPDNPQLKKKNIRVLAIDALEHAKAGKRVFANIVLLGFLASQFKKVQLKSLRHVVAGEFSSSKEKLQELEDGFRAKPRLR